MLPLSVLLVVVALVSVLASRLIGRLGAKRLPPPPRRSGHVLVLLYARPDESWEDVAWSVATRATDPSCVRFGVLVECTSEKDATDDVASTSTAHVVHVPRKHVGDPVRRYRRLVRRFVAGSETAVVVLDSRAVLVQGWDEIVLRLLVKRSKLTCPAAAGFPTLRESSTGTSKRGASRDFPRERTTGVAAVPSVCWCSEFTAARPDALVDDRGCYYLSTVPLLEPDPLLESDHLDQAPSLGPTPPTREQRVGLRTGSVDAERIRKFGSSRAARLAVEFAA